MAGYYCKNCKTIHGESYKLYEQIPINYYYKWNKNSKLQYRATSWNHIREVFRFANIL